MAFMCTTRPRKDSKIRKWEVVDHWNMVMETNPLGGVKSTPKRVHFEPPPQMPPPSPRPFPKNVPQPTRWIDRGYPTARWVDGAYQPPPSSTKWNKRTLLIKHIRKIS